MNRFFRSAVLSALIVLVAVPAVAATWTIDQSHSVLNFKIRHIFSKTGGTFGEWEGSLEFDGADPATLGGTVTIKTASINTENEDRDNHLRSPDFFNVEEFPTITFVSKWRTCAAACAGSFTAACTTKCRAKKAPRN